MEVSPTVARISPAIRFDLTTFDVARHMIETVDGLMGARRNAGDLSFGDVKLEELRYVTAKK